MKAVNPSAKEHHPDGVGKFVTEHVEPLWTRQPEESHKPKHDTQGEKPEFLGGPKAVMHRRARERGEEGFCQHPGWWQEENSDDQLEPALGDVRWNFARRGEIRATSAPVACRFRATSTLGSPTFHSSLLHFSMPGPCRRRCACRS